MSMIQPYELGRKSNFKPTIDFDSGRRRRQDTQNSIRKTKKEDRLATRRLKNETASPSEENGMVVNVGTSKFSKKDIPGLVQALGGNNPSDSFKLVAMKALNRFTEPKNTMMAENIDLVLRRGVLPYLVDLLQQQDDGKNSGLKLAAVWHINNITATDRIKDAAEAVGIAHNLVLMLQHSEKDIQKAAALGVGNIAAHSEDYRTGLLKLDALSPMLQIFMENPRTEVMLDALVYSVLQFCSGQPSLNYETSSQILHHMMRTLYLDLKLSDIKVNSLKAIKNLSEANSDLIQLMVEKPSFISKLIHLLALNDTPPLYHALQCLGNVISGSDHYTKVVIDAGILNYIGNLMNRERYVAKEACWIVSNIAGGSHDQLDKILVNTELLKQLLDRATNAPWDVRQEAVWAVTNVATKGREDQVLAIVQFGGIEALVGAINLGKFDCKLLRAILAALHRILDLREKHDKDYLIVVAESKDELEGLMNHQNEDIQKMVANILDTYFDESNSDEVENVVPDTTSNGNYAFGLTSKQLFSNTGESQEPPVLENTSVLNMDL